MTELFTIASDDVLVALIKGARRRLAVVAPALSDAVAAALIGRLSEVGQMEMTIVLDADSEVYRLGYGSISALNQLREAAGAHMVPLLLQPGVRIAMIAADEELLIFAPVPQLIEAGSTTAAKPNAIRLGGGVAAREVALAASTEIGLVALTPVAAEAVIADLKANPPLPFNVARAMRVFTSAARYVELEVENCKFSSRQIELPRELLDVADDDLRARMGGRIQPFGKALGNVTFLMQGNGSETNRRVDESWISTERARIAKAYTFVVPGFGRVILRMHQAEFDANVARFATNVGRYRAALVVHLETLKAEFIARLVSEFAPRWRANPPPSMTHWETPSPEELDKALEALAAKVADDAVTFGEPKARIIYKDIAPESVSDQNFVGPLTSEMKRRGVPDRIINKLFKTVNAAEEGGLAG